MPLILLFVSFFPGYYVSLIIIQYTPGIVSYFPAMVLNFLTFPCIVHVFNLFSESEFCSSLYCQHCFIRPFLAFLFSVQLTDLPCHLFFFFPLLKLLFPHNSPCFFLELLFHCFLACCGKSNSKLVSVVEHVSWPSPCYP